MSECKFNKQGNTANYEIKVDTDARRGYFEHHTLGDERGGGLWFEVVADPDISTALELIDYDGVSCLPRQVIAWLRENGFGVGEDFE